MICQFLSIIPMFSVRWIFNHIFKLAIEPLYLCIKSYRLWQKQAEVADDKTAEISWNAIQVKIFNFRFLASIIK